MPDTQTISMPDTQTIHNTALIKVDSNQLSWQAALERLGGDTGLLAYLSRDFGKQFRGESSLIRELMEQGDTAGAVLRLHTLKGLAATLGADALAQIADDLETELRGNGRMEDLEPEVAALTDALLFSIEALVDLADRLENHPGELALSEPDPQAVASDAAPRPTRSGIERPTAPANGSGSHFSGLPENQRLLVVDDQAATRQALHHMFRDHCEVVLASNGYKALEICRRQPPDLVLLDILMPEMDGYETCRRLKSEPATREIPIIFVTSENRPDQEARALEYGAVDFISKPLIPAVVRARVGTHLTLKAQADMLRCLAFVDGLTSIGNRRLFDDRLDLEWRACRRNRSSLSLLMIDIDHFKRYNDRLGHQQGDLCLKEVASILSGELSRSRDFLARYGGEEFACLLPETDLQGALAKAKALKEAVESREIPHPDSDCSEFVTICIGVASTLPQPGQSASDLVGAADGELYRAKSAGRNRIAVREPTPANPRPLEGKRPPIETPRRLAQTVRLVASAAG